MNKKEIMEITLEDYTHSLTEAFADGWVKDGMAVQIGVYYVCPVAKEINKKSWTTLGE